MTTLPMTRVLLLTSLFTVAASFAIPARSDTAETSSPPVVTRPGYMTMAEALVTAEIPKDEVTMTVVSNRNFSFIPTRPPGDTITNIATACGNIVVPYDDIEAVAPATRDILNTEPPEPNPYVGMPHQDAFKLLLGSLTQAQWDKLTGAIGLTYMDLTTDVQRDLFNAVFPAPLHVYLENPVPGTPASFRPDPISADALKRACLRIGKRYQVGVPLVDGSGNLLANGESSDPTPTYRAALDYGQNFHSMYGAPLKATVPNSLKDSDLDYSSDALHVDINLAGVKTVGDLVTRIGLATHVEIYANPHYENRRVLLLGAAPARADNLLRALALCVAGTYRQVGPAYVLTDDLVGAGVRRSIINNFAARADAARQDNLTKAGDTLFTAHHGFDGLPFLSNDTDLSAAEQAMMLKQRSQPDYVPGADFYITPTFSELAPQQRDMATKFKDDWESGAISKNPEEQSEHLTLEGKLSLDLHLRIEMEVPGLDGPIVLDNDLAAYDLMTPSSALRAKLAQRQTAATPQVASTVGLPTTSKGTPAPTLASIGIQLAPIGDRGLLVSPASAADVDFIVAAMKAIGLNQLWLDVFSGGVSPLDRPANAKGKDILTEALVQTAGTPIRVIPTIDVLKWSPDAPTGIQDLTMLGENSANAQTERWLYLYAMHIMQTSGDPNVDFKSTDTFVNPVAPGVRDRLIALVKRLASIPGVAGIALRDTLPNGYREDPARNYSLNDYTLGYTQPMRLAFLRLSHEDPVDLDPEVKKFGNTTPDTSLPEYDDPAVQDNVQAQWDVFRTKTNIALMTSLWETAQRTARSGSIPIWVNSRGPDFSTAWFGLWSDPNAPLPTIPDSARTGSYDPNSSVAVMAAATCRTNVVEIAPWQLNTPQYFSDSLKTVNTGWAGFVIDASDDDGGNTFTDLANALTGRKDSIQYLSSAPVQKPVH